MKKAQKRTKAKHTGIFKMSDVNKIEKMPLPEAQTYLIEKINNSASMLDENKVKARTMISGQKNIESLMISMCNFILAFEDKNLKVVSNFNSALI